ncbi:hypothetical protein EZV73_07770 [Acidaminobacter sp. JC074]|uniref:C39 family peptidase n=1 Tax=Acidaminobacter sp. JC074 TaxID=2530199 RepID=UPI001F0CE345|nr:C39 family peptidase [Acidaminobacter sp. JC074]MCH4887464.1 hypothetical protein [Acidaminobacter sp. JC074]
MLVYSLKDMIENAHLENLEYEDGYRLIDEKSLGRFESQALEVPETHRMVVSWNALVEFGGYVEVFIRVQTSGAWSPWMTYGKWCKSYSRGSITDQVYGHVRLDIDEVVSKEPINMCQLAFEITCDSYKPHMRDLFLAVEDVKDIKTPEVLNIDLEVPMVSQMLIHDIGTIACSPTALTMVLNYYGFEMKALDVARNSYDSGSDMYGNWAYNVAFAGSCNFEAYVDYCYDISSLMTYIQSGIPIVASVKTPEVISGAPQAYPEGHLMVIRGFLQEDDEAYIIVNDSASKTERDVKRYYKLEDFLKIWRHVIYVVRTKGKDVI